MSNVKALIQLVLPLVIVVKMRFMEKLGIENLYQMTIEKWDPRTSFGKIDLSTHLMYFNPYLNTNGYKNS